MEEDIIHIAIENFSANSNLNIVVKDLFPKKQDNGYDGVLSLSTNRKKIDFVFEKKKRLTLSKLPKIFNHINLLTNIILVSDYIPKTVKEFLKGKNISYLDTAGNAFITDNEELYIYIETNKNAPLTPPNPNRAFSKSGLKVVYQLLINDKTLDTSYRQIGEVAKVSIDTVRRVLKELQRDKFIVKINKTKSKLQNKERLFQEWVILFNRVLRPKLKQKSFAPKNFSNIRFIIDESNPSSIGGELAGEMLSNHLIAEKAIIYTDKSFMDLSRKLGLRPSTNGAITFIEQFWAGPILSNKKTVHAMLVYADLINSPTPRNLDTAKIIYDKYVKTFL
ncbi:type IV toxin-antitoxin system AbiEi family antitoxin [Aureispira sp. CCB-E]|uniref:type IV toxin-antitoxin system AbiEi family antitoxin n=1 Tax=Aureispira sp. CCB-E TaxID=3051121 RepID=UPI002868EE6D|nr:type IV toxin-antitoxin system AbiEi family antitoxin [Aureispira sp. CCB-E]WMX14960.1 type IV toxin-antitoxin system AbiEi family antitoxin [Aureispira sp. CCB-E]